MEKRLALALVLCLLWIIIAQMWLVSPPEPQKGDERTSKPTDQSEYLEEESASDQERDDTLAKADSEDETPASEVYEQTGQMDLQHFEIDTDVYRARFSNQGAVLTSLKLKSYFTHPELVDDPDQSADPENWLEILKEVRENTPSFVWREMAKPQYDLDQVIWEHNDTLLDHGDREVVFTYRTDSGPVFRKIFTFIPGAYHLEVRFEVENRNPNLKTKLNLVLESPCGIPEGKRAAFTQGPTAVLYKLNQERGGYNYAIETFPATSVDKAPYTWSPRQGEHLIFAGIMDNYFAMLMKPLEESRVKQVSIQALEDSSKVLPLVLGYQARYGAPPPERKVQELKAEARVNVKTDFLFGVKIPQPGEVATQQFMFYAGPKSTDLMQSPEYQDFYVLIEDSYGSMAWINKSLLWILRFFHSLVGNWGVAIIFLTFLVKLILFPLNRVQQVSMHGYSEKMKKLKPKLDELKKKYKNNKKKFNEAQMRLMKEEGLRPPLMGCLLVFLQFPVFIGLFQVLRTSIELRHSPFCLWINDLSQPDALCQLPFAIPFLGWDTLNLLPIGMTVAFYYQQKMMPKPASADAQAEQMQKIMKFMPIFFGFLLYNYAAGLSLYWMTSNLISIFEYKVIRKKFPVEAASAAKA